jgi:hypothetical protein
MALSVSSVRTIQTYDIIDHTFMENITHRAIIQNSYSTQVRLNATQILYIRPIPKRAMLSIIPSLEELPLLLQPIDDGVSVLLDAGSEDDELVPLAHFAEKLVAMRALMDVV